MAVRDFYVPYELQPWAAALDLNRLDDRLALGVCQFVLRAPEMTPAARVALGEQLRAAVLAVVAPPPPPWAPTPAVLIAVLGERRRRAEALAARRPVPTAAVQPRQPADPAPPAWKSPPLSSSADSPFAPPS
jgi:hypothetical protein